MAATLSYGLGTLVLPYATMLIDHSVVAACSLLTLWLLLPARDPDGGRPLALFAAGSAAGFGVILNNSAAFTALGLGAWLLWVCRPRTRALFYVAGGVAPALLLGWYHQVCFGDPFDIPQQHQLGMFQTAAAPLLGIFNEPNWKVLPQLLFLPYRGLFFSSPLLLLSLFG